MTKYILAQPTELRIYYQRLRRGAGRLHGSQRHKENNHSVNQDSEENQFYEKENKPNTMKCRFKTSKILTAAKETNHTKRDYGKRKNDT